MTVLFSQGNARALDFPDGYFHTCITSPPYWGLRDYGTAEWEGGDPNCSHMPDPTQGETGLRAGRTFTQIDPYKTTCKKCGASRIDSQMGMETTPEEYVENIVQVAREIRRVLRSDGTLWLNLGDSYIGSGGAGGDYAEGGIRAGQPRWKNNFKIERQKREGRWGGGNISPSGYLKPKDLCGIPWRVAFALQADGWWLRDAVVWFKPNAMPESVQDRPTKSYEFIFLLSPSQDYFYDSYAIREPYSEGTIKRVTEKSFYSQQGGEKDPMNSGVGRQDRNARRGLENLAKNILGNMSERGVTRTTEGLSLKTPEEKRGNSGVNKRNVWAIPTNGYKGAHFAVMPTALVEPCLLAGTSPRGCCPKCGSPWIRVIRKYPMVIKRTARPAEMGEAGRTKPSGTMEEAASEVMLGWRPGCTCYPDTKDWPKIKKGKRNKPLSQEDMEENDRAWGLRMELLEAYKQYETIPCRVLDPFAGAGTVGLVSARYGRDFYGVDLNPVYVEMARKRVCKIQTVMQL